MRITQGIDNSSNQREFVEVNPNNPSISKKAGCVTVILEAGESDQREAIRGKLQELGKQLYSNWIVDEVKRGDITYITVKPDNRKAPIDLEKFAFSVS